MGEAKTLKDYRDLAEILGTALGIEVSNNEAVKFFDGKIAEQGSDEIVIAAESQVMYLISHMLGIAS